jgi:hypothetical protein
MGQGKGNLGGKFSPWGHQLDLEAKAAPLADPLDLFKGEGRAGACSSRNPSRRPNCCPPHLSLATARRRSPAAEIPHHKHHAVVLLIQSISPPYLLDKEGGDIAAPYVCISQRRRHLRCWIGSDREEETASTTTSSIFC